MIVKKILLVLGLYAMSPALFGRPLVDVKVGYFFFTDSKMRRVFDHGGLDLQLSGAYPVYDILHIYGSFEYLKKSGRSLHGDQYASLWEIPVSLGLQPVVSITSHIEYYATIGPRYFFVHSHYHSDYVPKTQNANGLGGFVNTGFLFRVRHATFDIFGEYSYKKLHFDSHKPATKGHTVQVGGLTFGGGLGYLF